MPNKRFGQSIVGVNNFAQNNFTERGTVVMECTNCSLFECIDKETNFWQCGDPVSWYNPKTGEEVCRYQDGAVQRNPNDPTVPLSVVEAVLASVCMPEDDLKWFIKEIKQKAGW